MLLTGMLSLWGKPGTASNLSGAPQTWAGVLGAVLLLSGLELCCLWSLLFPVPWKERKGVCRAQREWCGQRRGGGCALGGEAVSQCLCPSLWVPFPQDFLPCPEQCSGWWWNVTQALRFYSPAEPVPFPSPQKPVQLLWKHLWLQPCLIVLVKCVLSEPDCQVS